MLPSGRTPSGHACGVSISLLGCRGILTAEVKALHDSYTEINRNSPAKAPKGRIFISKAVIEELDSRLEIFRFSAGAGGIPLPAPP